MLFIKSEVAGVLLSIVPSNLVIFALAICSFLLFFVGRRTLFRSLIRHLGLVIAVLIFSATTQGQNAIVTENALPGNPYANWGVTSGTDFRNPNLNGYATDISVNKGGTVHFKVDAHNGGTF